MPIPECRTRWAEEQAEQLLAIPLISEFVFRSPQNLTGPHGTQREVADHLILHHGKGLLVCIHPRKYMVDAGAVAEVGYFACLSA